MFQGSGDTSDDIHVVHHLEHNEADDPTPRMCPRRPIRPLLRPRTPRVRAQARHMDRAAAAVHRPNRVQRGIHGDGREMPAEIHGDYLQ